MILNRPFFNHSFTKNYQITKQIRSIQTQKRGRMVIKNQHEQYCETERRILHKIQKSSVLISLFFIVIIIYYTLFIRTRLPQHPDQTTSYSYINHYRPSSFVLLCDLYIISVGVLNSMIFKLQKKRKEKLQESMGLIVDYEKYYLEIFKITNFGILVMGLIRLFEEGLYQWAYQFGIFLYCIVQLVLADAMTNVESKILRAETDLDDPKQDQTASQVA